MPIFLWDVGNGTLLRPFLVYLFRRWRSAARSLSPTVPMTRKFSSTRADIGGDARA
jgi:hypothetical protein